MPRAPGRRTARMPTRPSQRASRWLVVGLGNQGERYARTRHNLGARVVADLRATLAYPVPRRHVRLAARVSAGPVVLALPTTFMNDSGHAVAALTRHFRVTPGKLLLVHDDKDLTFGTLRFQRGRGPAGHRGVASVIAALGTKDFWRLRVGIGAPPPATSTDAFVLADFTPREETLLSHEVVPSAVARLLDHLRAHSPNRASASAPRHPRRATAI